MMGYLATTTAAVDALSMPLVPLTDMTDPAGAASGFGRSGQRRHRRRCAGPWFRCQCRRARSVLSGGRGHGRRGRQRRRCAGRRNRCAGARRIQRHGPRNRRHTRGSRPAQRLERIDGPQHAGIAQQLACDAGITKRARPGPGSRRPTAAWRLWTGIAEPGDRTMAPQAFSAAESPLSTAAGLPAQGAGQISGLMGPLTALTSGMSGGLGGGPAAGPPPLSAAAHRGRGSAAPTAATPAADRKSARQLTKPSARQLGRPCRPARRLVGQRRRKRRRQRGTGGRTRGGAGAGR